MVDERRIESDGVARHLELEGAEDGTTLRSGRPPTSRRCLLSRRRGAPRRAPSSGRTWEWLPGELRRHARVEGPPPGVRLQSDTSAHTGAARAPALRNRRRAPGPVGRPAPGRSGARSAPPHAWTPSVDSRRRFDTRAYRARSCGTRSGIAPSREPFLAAACGEPHLTLERRRQRLTNRRRLIVALAPRHSYVCASESRNARGLKMGSSPASASRCWSPETRTARSLSASARR